MDGLLLHTEAPINGILFFMIFGLVPLLWLGKKLFRTKFCNDPKINMALKIAIALASAALLAPLCFMIFLILYTIAAPLWGETVFWGR